MNEHPPNNSKASKDGDMVWLIAIGAYLLLLVVTCLILKGGAIRECPKPQRADIELDPVQPIQDETPVAVASKSNSFGEWGRDVALSRTPSVQPHL